MTTDSIIQQAAKPLKNLGLQESCEMPHFPGLPEIFLLAP
jgi:hypothetical protein